MSAVIDMRQDISHFFNDVGPPKIVQAIRHIVKLVVVDFAVGAVEGEVAVSGESPTTKKKKGKRGQKKVKKESKKRENYSVSPLLFKISLKQKRAMMSIGTHDLSYTYMMSYSIGTENRTIG